MTFRYSIPLPAENGNKIARFRAWASANMPGVAFSLPPQVPADARALTVRVKSIEDRDRLKSLFPATLP